MVPPRFRTEAGRRAGAAAAANPSAQHAQPAQSASASIPMGATHAKAQHMGALTRRRRAAAAAAHLVGGGVVVAIQLPDLVPILGQDLPPPDGVRLAGGDPQELVRAALLGQRHHFQESAAAAVGWERRARVWRLLGRVQARCCFEGSGAGGRRALLHQTRRTRAAAALALGGLGAWLGGPGDAGCAGSVIGWKKATQHSAAAARCGQGLEASWRARIGLHFTPRHSLVPTCRLAARVAALSAGLTQHGRILPRRAAPIVPAGAGRMPGAAWRRCDTHTQLAA